MRNGWITACQSLLVTVYIYSVYSQRSPHPRPAGRPKAVGEAIILVPTLATRWLHSVIFDFITPLHSNCTDGSVRTLNCIPRDSNKGNCLILALWNAAQSKFTVYLQCILYSVKSLCNTKYCVNSLNYFRVDINS